MQAPPSQLCEYVKNSIRISTRFSALLHETFTLFISVNYLENIITIVKQNILLYSLREYYLFFYLLIHFFIF